MCGTALGAKCLPRRRRAGSARGRVIKFGDDQLAPHHSHTSHACTWQVLAVPAQRRCPRRPPSRRRRDTASASTHSAYVAVMRACEMCVARPMLPPTRTAAVCVGELARAETQRSAAA